LKLSKSEPDDYVHGGGELPLSAGDLEILLRAVTERNVPFRFQARGFSMTPFIRDRDVLTAVPILLDDASVGDVAVFTHPESRKLTVHRIVARTSEGFLMKGDGSLESDGVISESKILARIVRIERKGYEESRGLGPGRGLLAVLSRYGLLQHLISGYHRVTRALRLGKSVGDVDES